MLDANPLARGFYTASEAARLIEVGRIHRINGWLEGYPRSKVGPLLERDYKQLGDHQELSFYDLMEVRFVEHFRECGVRVQTLRRALAVAKEVFGVNKPLATNRVRFIPSTGGLKIYVHETDQAVATKDEDPKLWNLLSRQYEHYQLIHNLLERGVAFDATSRLAMTWHPRPKSFPEIVVDPRQAYGRPILPDGTPTAAVYEAWLADGKNDARVAEWFKLLPADVQMAIEFETDIRRPRQATEAA